MTAPLLPTSTVPADEVGQAAAELAREALVEQVGAADVGGHLAAVAEGELVTTHYFTCMRAGYLGWRWSVTVARAPEQDQVTVDEIVLLPGDEAIVAPAWVPYRERIRPGDLSPGDILPTADDDPRLVPAYTASDEIDDRQAVRAVADELGLGRERVLSLEGREEAAQRWHDGSQGPDVPLAQSAPGRCVTCGFMVRLAGPLSQGFGVCANGLANDDGKVVALGHGCGAHSQARLGRRSLPEPLPEPVYDTVTPDELDIF